MALGAPLAMFDKNTPTGKAFSQGRPLPGTVAADPYLSFLNTQNAANVAGLNQFSRNTNRDVLEQNSQYNFGARGLNEDFGFSNRLNNLDIAGNQIDRNAAQRVLNSGGLYDVQQQGLDASRGLLGRELANQMRGFGFDQSTATRAAKTNLRGSISDAAARGAAQNEGLRNKVTDIYGNLYDQFGQINVGREGARISNERGKISLNNQQAGLTENKAQARDRTAQIDLQAQRLGISGEQLRNNLTRGLEKLGIDKRVNTNALIDGLMSKSAETKQQALQLYYQALDYGGFFPR